MTKILYVEDELALAGIVKETLEGQGYDVHLVSDGGQVLTAVPEFEPDICLFDVMLPNVDGFTLAKELQKKYSQIPIIFLSAKNQTSDVVEGFKSGGNDYMKKPFSLEELIMRIENLLHLQKGVSKISNDSIFQIGKYIFNPQKLELILGESRKKLTHREAEVIKKFAQNKNGVVNRKELLIEVWGDDSYFNSRSLDVYVKKLRDYLSKDEGIAILTLRGVGYRFNIEEI